MQVHSIIANTISEEILRSGHLSIRFMADGFSLLLEDRSFNPVVLNRFTEETARTMKSHVQECKDWLQRHTLLEKFSGEVTIVNDFIPSTLVPDPLFNEKSDFMYLEPVTQLRAGEKVMHIKVKNRPFTIVYAVQNELGDLIRDFNAHVRVKPPIEILLSVADQVNASDHQRGFAIAEVQQGFLGILVIREDQLVLLNNIRINSNNELVYHILNTLQQVRFDRRSRPLFLAGASIDEEMSDLTKYIRHIAQLPYHINDIEKSSIPDHILLAEASRCE